MEVIKNVAVPTGNILIVKGEQGLLELVSIGDYGKDKNIKADFMGLSRKIHGVPHSDLLPLEEKWVITVSTQYGCSMGCKFCDVPKVGPGKNATFDDLINQVKTGISLHPEVEQTNRLNVHYARMGEPTFNYSVINSTLYLAGWLKEKGWGFHPVVSTMMPKNNMFLRVFLKHWMQIKNDVLNGEAGLQISINTTNEAARKDIFNSSALTLEEISATLYHLPKPKGRKITLNFALTDHPIDASLLKLYFDPEDYLCKITPMHMTNSCKQNDLITGEGYAYEFYYPYEETEYQLKKAGFDVIVFIPSKEEDESRITCGNAILSDKEF